MFGWAFTLLFLSLFSALLGISGVLGAPFAAILIVASVILIVGAMAAFSIREEPRTTCFIYPTFSCKV